MRGTSSYTKIALSTILIATISGCGTVQSASTQKNNQKTSPFIQQTLTPSEMPLLEALETSGKNSRARYDVSMSLNKNTVEKNNVVTVNLQNMPDRYDWVGLFYKGDSSKRDNLLTYAWTQDSATVKIRIANTLKRRHKDDITSGNFELRAFTQSGKYIQLAKSSLTVEDANQGNNATITIQNSEVSASEELRLTLTNFSGEEGEWIGIFPKGSANKWENSWSWTYTEEMERKGVITLEGVPSGAYDIRLFNDASMVLSASTPLTVHALENANTTMSITKNTFASEEKITVSYAGMPGNNDDWIGIFEKNAGNSKDAAYDYYDTDGQLNGAISFPALDTTGNFQIRAFHAGATTPAVTRDIRLTNGGNQGGGNQGNQTKKVAIFADEHDPHNRLLAVDYENMDLVEEVAVQGSKTHHADVVGNVDTAKYVLMVPKGSTYINVYTVKDRKFVKKIDLPFNPRSADAFNASKNLVLLTASNRPAAVLLDASTWEIVGNAGLNNTCNLKFNKANYHPWYYKNIVYSWKNIESDNITCVAPDFGGTQISGHPAWLGNKHFAILDRANRLVHVYRLDGKNAEGEWKISLTDSVKTNTSIHQLIPSGNGDDVYYGMSEGNGKGKGISPIMYKWKFENGKLRELAKTTLVTQKTVTIMKNVGAYAGYNNYWNQYKNAQQYYQYRYPTYFPNKYQQYYPGNYNNYYNNYYNNNNWNNYQQQYVQKVPVQVQKQFNSLGGHNLYISPEVDGVRSLWGAVASGQTFVVNEDTMKISNVVKSDKGAGHVNFQKNGNYAIITNHKSKNVTIANYKTQKFVKNIALPYADEGIFAVKQSHAPYVTKDGKYFHNTWTDGGVFFRINLNTLTLDQKSLYTGGIPIQGNYYPNYKGD